MNKENRLIKPIILGTFLLLFFILINGNLSVFHFNEKSITETKGFFPLVKPAFALASEMSFLEEAGISIYTKVTQPLDLSKVQSAFKIIEKATSTYVIGSVSLPDLPETDDVHCFAQRDGLVVIYYFKDEPVSKIIDWNYYTAEGLTKTKLQTGLRKICKAMGVTLTAMGYYHFQYPDANKLMIITDCNEGGEVETKSGAWTSQSWISDSFKLKIPSDLIIYERSWSHCAGKGTVMKYGLLFEMQLGLDTFHTIEAIGYHSHDAMWGDTYESSYLKVNGETISHIENSNTSEVAIVLLYREPSASEVSTRILVEYAPPIFTVSLEHPSLFKLSSSLTISSTTTSISLNKTITVSGGILPPFSGVTLILKYTKPDGTLLGRTVVTKSDGGYVDAFKLDQTGVWEVKTSWIGNENYYGAESSPIYFEVTPIIFNLTIQTPHKDIPIEVDGEKYVTDTDGKIEVKVSSDFNLVNVKIEPQVFSTDFRAIFIDWGDGETTIQRTLTINNNTILTANYKLQYYLEVKTSPQGLIDISSNGWYDAGTEVIMGPFPVSINISKTQYMFQEWLVNGIKVRDNPFTIHIDRPFNVIANYFQKEALQTIFGKYSLTISLLSNSTIRTVSQLPSGTGFSMVVDESTGTKGVIKMLIPKEILQLQNSTIDKVMVFVDRLPTISSVAFEGNYLWVSTSYPYGRHSIDLYYNSYDIQVKVLSQFSRRPIQDALVKILWEERSVFFEGKTDSSGSLTINLPSCPFIIETSFWGGNDERRIYPSNTSTETFLFLIYYDFIMISVLVFSGFLLVAYRKRQEMITIRALEKPILEIAKKYGSVVTKSLVTYELGIPVKKAGKALDRFDNLREARRKTTSDLGTFYEFPTARTHLRDDEGNVIKLLIEANGKNTRAMLLNRAELSLEAFDNVMRRLEQNGIVIYYEISDEYKLRGVLPPEELARVSPTDS